MWSLICLYILSQPLPITCANVIIADCCAPKKHAIIKLQCFAKYWKFVLVSKSVFVVHVCVLSQSLTTDSSFCEDRLKKLSWVNSWGNVSVGSICLFKIPCHPSLRLKMLSQRNAWSFLLVINRAGTMSSLQLTLRRGKMGQWSLNYLHNTEFWMPDMWNHCRLVHTQSLQG